MKKIIIIGLTLLLLTGCGMSDEEKEKMLYDSLDKAYTAVYLTDGVGLAVYPDEIMQIDNKDWYQVAISKYNKVAKLTSLADDVYTEDIAKKMNKVIKSKYTETDKGLYTTSEGGCLLPYQLDETAKDSIKKDVKIKKIKMNKIIFEYQGKEYEAKKSGDNYKFDKKIFKCEIIEE